MVTVGGTLGCMSDFRDGVPAYQTVRMTVPEAPVAALADAAAWQARGAYPQIGFAGGPAFGAAHEREQGGWELHPYFGAPASHSIVRCPDMTADHSSYDDLARERRDSPEYREGYAEAQRAYLIGQAVRERRLVLGLSQTELAGRAGMTQPALSRLEAGGVIPTIPLLERISAALDADLIVQISPHAA